MTNYFKVKTPVSADADDFGMCFWDAEKRVLFNADLDLAKNPQQFYLAGDIVAALNAYEANQALIRKLVEALIEAQGALFSAKMTILKLQGSTNPAREEAMENAKNAIIAARNAGFEP